MEKMEDGKGAHWRGVARDLTSVIRVASSLEECKEEREVDVVVVVVEVVVIVAVVVVEAEVKERERRNERRCSHR